MLKARIALAGNPNCGKTTLFNLLTGARQHVGNWPGVTVEKKEGTVVYDGCEIELVDLPGTYSLSPNSLEEKIARSYIMEEKPDLVLNIIDGTALERSLALTAQIIDTGIPFITAVNMYDEVLNKGIEIDLQKMETLLKAPVLKIIAKREEGIVPLLKTIVKKVRGPEEGKAFVNYGEDIESAVDDIECRIRCDERLLSLYPPRWLALQILQEDKEAAWTAYETFGSGELREISGRHIKRLKDLYKDEMEIIFSEKRFGFIQGIIHECVSIKKSPRNRKDLTEALDAVLLNRILSFPLFGLILWGTFQLTFLAGGFLSGFIDAGIRYLDAFIHNFMPAGMLKDLLSDGIISGVGGILVFFPQIMILFFIIAILEDSGYMARAAFIMDRLMHFLGIHGKSFISLFMGIGCNVPGILAARTLENEEDRKVTVLINPFMSCSARLPIYVLIAGMFFGQAAGTVIFLLYILGVLAAVITAKILKTFFFRKKSVPFVMELPPYRMPSAKSLMVHMWERASLFLKKMGGVILVGSILIWALGYFPKTARYSEKVTMLERQAETEKDTAGKALILKEAEAQKSLEQVENSFIGRMGKAVEPFFKPLGFGWKEGVALITGIVGKEIVVSTISVLYGAGKTDSAVLKSKMAGEGMTPVTALSFMVFVLLYIPCLAAIAAVLKETNSVKWTLFSIFYGILAGYLVSLLVNSAGKILIN